MFKFLRILFTVLCALCFVALPIVWFMTSFEVALIILAVAALFFILMLISKKKQEEDEIQ